MSIARPKDFYIFDLDEIPLYFSTHNPWEMFLFVMVISGGGLNKCTMGSVKRRFKQIMGASSDKNATLDKFIGSYDPIAF